MPSPSNASDTPFLIVNADDFGLSEGTNRAVFEGHDHGIVTSASLMATGAAFEHAVRGARARPRLGCGVHLVLHDDVPCADPARIPSLVGARGKLRGLHEVLRGLVTGVCAPEHVEIECAAQIERALGAGIEPTHLDSHCHLHALPAVVPIVHRLGRRYGIACVRSPETTGFDEFRGSPWSRYPLALLITASHRVARRAVADPLRAPDRFLGLVKSGDLDAAWVVRAIEKLPAGRVSELMVHPGDGSGAGDPHGDHGPEKRRGELVAVTAAAVRDAVKRRGVELVDYRFLAPA